ncbi:MAG: phage minor head protein, partial [Rhodocyclaceae bacterium]|nr:phage minor head protein [Rhodocyclaceae bacterium]
QALIDAPLLAAGFRIDGMVPLLDTRQLVAMRAFMTDRIKNIGLQAANKINTELGLVVLGAQPPGAAIMRVAAILGDISRARAITIVRTELSRVYGTASQQRLTQAAGVVDGLKKQWRRSGKVHSRITHDLADGQVVDADKPFKLGNGMRLMFPHDPAAPAGETINCGCTALPWKADWEVATPGRRRYSELEMQGNPAKRDIQEQLDNGKPIRALLAVAKDT